MVIYIQYKFHEIPSIGLLVMTEDRKTLRFKQSKGNKSSIAEDTLVKRHVPNHIMPYILSISFMKLHSLVT